MRPEVVEAERRHAVRKAARSWKKAGWISPEAEREIAARFADDRQRQGVALRTLLWVFTMFAVSSALGMGGTMLSVFSGSSRIPPSVFAFLLLAAGILCVFLAEAAYGSMRLLDFGPESALAWSGLGLILGGSCWLFFEAFDPPNQLGLLVTLGIATVLFALGAWRWGSWMMAALAGLALLGILAGLPWGRLAWLAAALATAPVWFRASTSANLAPGHRRAASALLWVAMAAAAAAVFPPSVDDNWIEHLGLRRNDTSPIPVTIAWLASGALAATAIVLGVRTRRLALLNAGILFGALVDVAAAEAIDARPIWLLLILAGGGLMGVALLLRRWLDAGPDHERNGFTTAALLEDPASRRALEAAVAMATASPEARSIPTAAPTVEGHGGQFGGGGASGDF